MKNSETSDYNIKTIILSTISILTLVTSLAFSYYFNNLFTKCPPCYNTDLQYDDSAILIQRIRWKKPVNIYVINSGDRASKTENVLQKIGLDVKITSKPSKSGIEWADIVLIDSDWTRSIGVKYKRFIINVIKLGKPLTCYGPDAGNKFIELIGQDFFLDELTLYVGGEPFSDKTPNLKLPAEVKLFSIVTCRSQGGLLVPDYLIIIRDVEDLERDIVELLNWLVDLGIIDGEVEHHSITEVNGFKYVGSIGWKFFYIRYCNNDVGELQVRSRYYYYGEEVSGVFYSWFLILSEHSTIGYRDLTWCRACPYASWVLYKAKTEVDGHTDIFPGQIFEDIGPKNAGTCISSINYVVSTGINAINTKVSASYNPNRISYTSSVNTAAGVVEWTYFSCQHATDITRQFVSSAIFYLDPMKEYGYEPLVVTHYYYSEIKGYTIPQCGGTAYTYKQISYTAYVKNSGVSQG